MGYDMGIIRHKQYTLWLFPKLWKPYEAMVHLYSWMIFPWFLKMAMASTSKSVQAQTRQLLELSRLKEQHDQILQAAPADFNGWRPSLVF